MLCIDYNTFFQRRPSALEERVQRTLIRARKMCYYRSPISSRSDRQTAP